MGLNLSQVHKYLPCKISFHWIKVCFEHILRFLNSLLVALLFWVNFLGLMECNEGNGASHYTKFRGKKHCLVKFDIYTVFVVKFLFQTPVYEKFWTNSMSG